MKNKIFGLVALLVILLAGGWYVFSRGAQPPEQRVKTAFVNLLKEQKGHLRSEIVFQPGKDSQATFKEIKINTDGDFQKGSSGPLELATTLSVVGQATGASFTGKGETILVGGKTFYRIDELPPIFSDAEKITGKWIAGASNMTILSEKMRNSILKSFQDQKVFSEVKKLGNEKIDGVSTTHFQAKLSSAGYSSFLAELVTEISGDVSVSKEQIEKNVSQLNGLLIDVWIDSANNLRKLNMFNKNAQDGSTTDISIYFSKFEGKLKIEEPQGALQLTLPTASTSPVGSVNK